MNPDWPDDTTDGGSDWLSGMLPAHLHPVLSMGANTWSAHLAVGKRRLAAPGLLKTGNSGMQKTVQTLVGANLQIRGVMPIDAPADAWSNEAHLPEIASGLRFTSGAFNQAARSAAIL